MRTLFRGSRCWSMPCFTANEVRTLTKAATFFCHSCQTVDHGNHGNNASSNRRNDKKIKCQMYECQLNNFSEQMKIQYDTEHTTSHETYRWQYIAADIMFEWNLFIFYIRKLLYSPFPPHPIPITINIRVLPRERVGKAMHGRVSRVAIDRQNRAIGWKV